MIADTRHFSVGECIRSGKRARVFSVSAAPVEIDGARGFIVNDVFQHCAEADAS